MSVTWNNTRLAVIVDGDTANPLTPVEAFTPSFSLATEVVHSLEATHIGYISNPDNYSFTITVKAIGDGAAKLTKLAMQGTEFQVGMYEAAGSAGEWDFSHVLLSKCRITSANPSNGTINGAPTATFSGVARAVDVGAGDEQWLRPPFTN